MLSARMHAVVVPSPARSFVFIETSFIKFAPMYLEIKEMNQRVAHNIPVEKLFLEIAYKYQLEDMMQFAQLLEYGKRSGRLRS